MTTRAGSTPSSVKMRSCARPTGDWTPWVVIAMPVCFDARAAARWTRSSRALTHGLSVPISPMIPGRMPPTPTPSLQLADHLGRKVVDAAAVDERLGRVVRLAVPAGAHHDVDAEALARRRSRSGSRPTPGEREVDQRSAAAPAEFPELLDDEVVVGGELPVVPSVRDVPQADAGVLVREREAELLGRDRSGDGHDARRHRSPPRDAVTRRSVVHRAAGASV